MSTRTPIADSAFPDPVEDQRPSLISHGPAADSTRSLMTTPAPVAIMPPPAPSGRILYIASTGGHLAELNRLSAHFDEAPGSMWITFDTQQSRSVLAGREVAYVPYVSPRDLKGVVRAFFGILRVMRQHRFDVVVSTGAAVAVSGFLAARLLRIPSLYIESVARITGPSLTGRIISTLRLAKLRTQHVAWSSRRWQPQDSVLADFRNAPITRPSTRDLKIFVTLGTIRPYRFDALIDAVLATGLATEHSVWQLGATARTDLPGRATALMTHEEFLAEAAAADVVITHAGVGTVLELLELGIHPVVVPRSRARHEHVDDHQYEIADYLRTLEVATVVEAERLSDQQLIGAAATRTMAG